LRRRFRGAASRSLRAERPVVGLVILVCCSAPFISGCSERRGADRAENVVDIEATVPAILALPEFDRVDANRSNARGTDPIASKSDESRDDIGDAGPTDGLAAWSIESVGGGVIESRGDHAMVVVGGDRGDGVRLSVSPDAANAHELEITAIDLEGRATLRLSVDGVGTLWTAADGTSRFLVNAVESIEVLIYQDEPFATAIHSVTMRPLQSPAMFETEEIAALRADLDPDLYHTAALQHIQPLGPLQLRVDGELLVVTHDGEGPAGLLLGWSADHRESEPLPLIVDSVEGEVFLGRRVAITGQSVEPLAVDLTLIDEFDGPPSFSIFGVGPFVVRIAAAGADTRSIRSLLERDRARDLDSDDVWDTIIWTRDRVHRGTRLALASEHGPHQYLLLRRGRFQAICGSMSGMQQWMLRSLGVPARRVQFLGHRFLDLTEPGDTHVAVEAWVDAEQRWILSDPTFACFWTHDEADPTRPIDTTELWHAVKRGRTPVPIFVEGSDLPLPRRSPAEYYLPYDQLFGAVEFSREWIPGPLGARRVPASRLGPPRPNFDDD